MIMENRPLSMMLGNSATQRKFRRSRGHWPHCAALHSFGSLRSNSVFWPL